jgi:hypothetical protein
MQLAVRIRALFARPKFGSRAKACAGFAVALAVLCAVGEAYLRVAPPANLQEYLPNSDRSGPFAPDARYGIRYRSPAALEEDCPHYALVRKFAELPDPPPCWAFFGNSFVQMPGALADTARAKQSKFAVVNLPRVTTPVPIRFAQAEVLLATGLKPARAFFTFIPLDAHTFELHSLSQTRATPGGALAYEPRTPAVSGALVRNSRLALAGYTRTGLHHARPFAKAAALYDTVPDSVRADVRALFVAFAETAKRYRVPVSVVLLPSYEQVTRTAGFAVQDAIAEEARAVGWCVCDVRAAFRAHPNKPELFLPDKHFSAPGNELLLREVMKHAEQAEARP